MKKSLSILLILAMLLGLMAACGTDTAEAEASEVISSQTEPISEEEAVAEVPVAKEEAASAVETSVREEVLEYTEYTVELPLVDEETTITYWTSLDPRINDYLPNENVEDALLAYGAIREKTGINIHLNAVSVFNQSDLFNLMVVGGDYSDIIYGVMDLYSTGYSGAINDDVIIDVREMLEEYAPSVLDIILGTNELKATLVDEQGRIGVIPMLYKETGLEAAAYVYRTDWAEEAGISTINTVEDYHNYLSYASETYGAYAACNGNGGPGGDTSNGVDSFLCQAMGGFPGYYQLDGVAYCGYLDDAYYDYLEVAASWYQEGIYDQEMILNASSMTQQQQDFGVGKAASCLCNGAAGISELYAYSSSDGNSDKLSVGVIGHFLDEGVDQWLVSEKNTVQKDGVWSISTACDDPELLCQLVNWLFTEEGSMICSYGVENVTYTLDENGTPQWTDLIVNNPDGYSTTITINMYATAFVPHLFDQRRTFYDFDEVQLASVEVFKGEDVSRNNIPRLAKGLWTDDELENYNAVQSEVSTYLEQMELSFITGTTELNEANWNTFLDTMESLGVQDLIDLYQIAYDRYQERLSA